MEEDASKARMISKDRRRREKHGGTEDERECGSMRSTRMRRRRMQARQGWRARMGGGEETDRIERRSNEEDEAE